MGPFNEMRQLSRRGAVLQLLQKNNIAMDEERYNARVITTFKNATSGVFNNE